MFLLKVSCFKLSFAFFPHLPMALPDVQLFWLEQGDRSLEAHTRDFLSRFPDRSLSHFYCAGLSERSKARVQADGPKEDFATFMEWVLVHNHLPFTIVPAEEDSGTSPTPPPPETSHPPPTTTGIKEVPEPTADRGDRTAAIDEPSPRSPNHSEGLTMCVSRLHHPSWRESSWSLRIGTGAPPISPPRWM
ncbi:uncharacterized protein [Pseudorasbora parva]|uniref:uncharacterized protein isoform X2 n=1 Tax=Pseudorasbora parva TaxID=51549 RepID=UPI00351DE0C7